MTESAGEIYLLGSDAEWPVGLGAIGATSSRAGLPEASRLTRALQKGWSNVINNIVLSANLATTHVIDRRTMKPSGLSTEPGDLRRLVRSVGLKLHLWYQ